MRSYQKELSTEKMAQVLGVSRSGFYRPHRDSDEETFDKGIQKIFKEHKGRYGSSRIHAEFRRQGVFCSRYKTENKCIFES